MKNIAAFSVLPVVILASGLAEAAVPPTIHVQWDNPASEEDVPRLDINYRIIGAPDSPDVELRTGRDDWRVWSTDLDEADGVGNIGTISSPFNGDFTMRLAANGSAAQLMLYWGPYIDGDRFDDNPEDEENPPESLLWAHYRDYTLPAMKAAGFTHLSVQIADPATNSETIAERLDDVRDLGLPLAFFESPGHQILKKFCNECPPQCATCSPPQCPECFGCQACPEIEYQSSNELHKKYFDTVAFDPNCYANPSQDCDNHPHTLSLDPKYAGPGTLWEKRKRGTVRTVTYFPCANPPARPARAEAISVGPFSTHTTRHSPSVIPVSA